MPRRTRLSGGFTRQSRRQTTWAFGPGGDDIAFDPITISATGTQIFGAGITPVIPNLTLVRLRGVLDLRLTAADAGDVGFTWAFGVGKVANDAFLAGVAAIPDPFDDIEWPGWIYHNMGTLMAPQEVLDLNQVPAFRLEVDSKSMRKLRLNEVLFAAIQVSERATAQIRALFVSRTLFKLP